MRTSLINLCASASSLAAIAAAYYVPIMVDDDPEGGHHTAKFAKRIAVHGIDARPLSLRAAA